MLERLLLSGLLIVAGVSLYLLLRRLHLHRIGRRLARSGIDTPPGLEAFEAGRPALLYFSTQQCIPCRTVLRPAVQKLAAELENRFQVLEIDAQHQTEAVQHWEVASVPTIFVLDPCGEPQHVHYGVVSPGILRNQLAPWIQEPIRTAPEGKEKKSKAESQPSASPC